VINTIHPEYLSKVISHARASREKVSESLDSQKNAILVIKDWMERLLKYPFTASKLAIVKYDL
jgi:hypothetical protein